MHEEGYWELCNNIMLLYTVWLLKQSEDATNNRSHHFFSHIPVLGGFFFFMQICSYLHHLCHETSAQHKVVFICPPNFTSHRGFSLCLCVPEWRQGPCQPGLQLCVFERQQHWSSAVPTKAKSFWQHGVTTEKPTETTAQVGQPFKKPPPPPLPPVLPCPHPPPLVRSRSIRRAQPGFPEQAKSAVFHSDGGNRAQCTVVVGFY